MELQNIHHKIISQVKISRYLGPEFVIFLNTQIFLKFNLIPKFRLINSYELKEENLLNKCLNFSLIKSRILRIIMETQHSFLKKYLYIW